MSWEDKVLHFLLNVIITFIFGWKVSTTMSLTIEATQAESGGNFPWMASFWTRLLRWDTLFDLIADGLGLLLGLFLRKKLLGL